MLYYGGTVRLQAQHHDECPIGASISHLLYAGHVGHAGMGHTKARRPLLPRVSPGGRATARPFSTSAPCRTRTAPDHVQFPRSL